MKSTPTSLLAEIRANVTTLAVCIEIRRQDGKAYRITNHDSDLTLDGSVYTHSVPFILSAIASGSNLSADNAELTLALDGTVFLKPEFDKGAFDSAEITIALVNFQNTAHGKIVLREGWFGPIDTNEFGVAKVSLFGLLKVLDFDIGRVYQPSCDADLGDSRCKIAVRQNQIYNTLEPYHVGDWVYYFDPTLATAITITNPSFEADGPTATGAAITGWTLSPGSGFRVRSAVGSLGPYAGSYFLYGDAWDTDDPKECYVYQTIDLLAAGLSDTAIDDGKISIAWLANLAQTEYLLDPIRLRMEVLDVNGEVIDYYDDGYKPFDNFGVWRERSSVGPLLSGARYVRLYIYWIIKDGVVFNGAADNLRLYWWDHTLGNPFSDVIYRLTRITDFGRGFLKLPTNNTFESQTVTNSNTATITGWTRDSSADWWRVIATSYLGLVVPDGQRALVGGDDSSGTQKTYLLNSAVQNLVTTYGLNADRIDLGKIITRIKFVASWYDADSSSRVIVNVYDATDTLLTSVTVLDFVTKSGAPVAETVQGELVLPVGSRKIEIALSARSGVGSSAANVGFDNFQWYFVDAELPRKDDPLTGYGNSATEFSTTAGAYTVDGNLIWKAHTVLYEYDTVSAAFDRKAFTGTNIAGGENAFATAVIRWISGANAGQKNIIRIWNGDTKAIKLYFPCINDIQVGDRFHYVRPCHKRFLEDCVQQFDNALNFRGFPHLPGKLTD